MSAWGAALDEPSSGTELCPPSPADPPGSALQLLPWAHGAHQTHHPLPSCAKEGFGYSRLPPSPRFRHKAAEICTFWSTVSSPGCSGSLGMSLTIMDSKRALMHTHSISFPYAVFPTHLCNTFTAILTCSSVSTPAHTSLHTLEQVFGPWSPRWKCYLPFWAALVQGTQFQFIPISRLKTSPQRW